MYEKFMKRFFRFLFIFPCTRFTKPHSPYDLYMDQM